MYVIFVHIIAPVISGCAVAYFTYWLSSKRNKQKATLSRIKNPLTTANSEGVGAYMHIIFVK